MKICTPSLVLEREKDLAKNMIEDTAQRVSEDVNSPHSPQTSCELLGGYEDHISLLPTLRDNGEEDVTSVMDCSGGVVM